MIDTTFIDKAFEEGRITEKEYREMVILTMQKERGTAGKLDMSPGEVRKYSLFRALEASVTGNWEKAGFERECSGAVEDQVGTPPKGFYMPYDVQFERTLTKGGAGTGAEMVGTTHQGFIDALREKTLVLNLGAQLLSGLVGNVEIPSMGDATFYHVTEDADVTDSTPATAEVTLSPKTVGGSVPLSRRIWKQSSPGIEGVLRKLLVEGLGVEMDAKILNGSGASGQPTGILNATGIGTVTISTAGQPTWAELVEFETDVLTAKALGGALGYLITPAVLGHCKTTLKASGVAGYLMEDGKINGYRALPTTNMPTNGVLFGDYSRLMVGLWGGIDIKADEATKAAAGGLVMRVFADYDVAAEYTTAFSKNA